MHCSLFIDEIGEPTLEHIDYSADLPAELSQESYVKMYQLVWATIRHDFYKGITAVKEAKKAETSQEDYQLNDDEFSEVYGKNLNSFEAVRTEIYEKVMGVKLSHPNEAKTLM